MDYINTCLKLKAEASGYPCWVYSPEDEDRYVESFRQSEWIRLDKEAIRYNTDKRGLTKLWLNSMWGKLTVSNDRKMTKIITEPKKPLWIFIHSWHRGDEPRVRQR